MKRTLLVAVVALFTLGLVLPAADAWTPIRYRPVTLNTRVYITDNSFKDFGSVAARGTFGVKGAGVGVCVVDTGVDATHEQLDSQLVAFKDFVNGRTVAYDDHGHGTHVASIVLGDGVGTSKAAGKYRGVAPKASLYVAKVLDRGGSGVLSTVIQGVQWCASKPGVQVISMSLGTREASDGTDELSQAANAAVAKGKTVVVAAGNMGPDPTTIGSPGAAAGAITVGAEAEWSGGKTGSQGPYLAAFSSRGPVLGANANNPKPDVVAPGVTITAAQANTGRYVAMSGTSMATPYVAGTVALILQANPTLTPAQVKAKLAQTALDLGKPGQDPDYGWGLVNTYSAVASARGLLGRNIFPPHVTVTGSAAPGVNWVYQPLVTNLTQPVAATVIFDSVGGLDPYPNYDAFLRAAAPSNRILASSFCPNGSSLERIVYGCGVGASGRQQTLGAVPDGLGENGSTYTIFLFPDVISSPSESRPGTFTADIFWR